MIQRDEKNELRAVHQERIRLLTKKKKNRRSVMLDQSFVYFYDVSGFSIRSNFLVTAAYGSSSEMCAAKESVTVTVWR